jgi:hypothetical protein
VKPTLILIIRNHANQGEKILGNRWLPFIEHLREELRRYGSEHNLSNDTQLIFTCSGYYTPFSALLSSLEKSKQACQWPNASGPPPLQFIVEFLGKDTPLTESVLPDKKLWNEIQQETIYLSPLLQNNWQEFASHQNFPDHKLSQESNGLARITFVNHDIGKQEPLLAYRTLPISQQGKECFYCGMTTHHPSHCPSKMLGMDSWGLSDIGYLNFDELNILYKKVFPEKPAIVARLREGIKTVQLRKDNELLVFVSFFDLSVIFQLRFLWNYAFSSYSKWTAIYQTDKIKINNRNLHLGLDCLRVNQYEQAEELLQNELKRHDGQKFAANIGLAFLSLECNRNSDVARYLETARNNAKTTTEIIYANLILSRHYEIIKDFWSAKEAVTNALKADYDCLDAQYRRIQLSVRENNLNEREFKQLRSLVLGQKDIFIRSLLDPTLLPIQGTLDEFLAHQYKTISFDATHNLQEAATQVKKLSLWLDAADKRNTANNQAIKEMQTNLNKKSYFHQLDVSEKANGLFFTCTRLRKNQADQLSAKLARYKKQLNNYLKFWKSYPYKKFNTTFYPAVVDALKNCRNSTELLKKSSSRATKEAIALSKQVKTGYEKIKKEYGRILLIRTIINGLKIFARKLLICECAGLLIMVLAAPAIQATLGDMPSLDWLIQLTADDGVQKKTMLISTLFIAPFFALSWALIELQRE